MPTFTSDLEKYIIRRYAINSYNISIMIEDEWDYIEEQMHNPDGSIEHIAKELVDMYMAA
ncbi:MAG: hypothetical protein U9N52_12130 [Campylobacterota bacterium]|nr:hypothetical protein [Campylobacterota bacterium]